LIFANSPGKPAGVEVAVARVMRPGDGNQSNLLLKQLYLKT